MKKYLYSLILLLVISINAYADGLTATLQQGDQMTPFYGNNAFYSAYKAADSGAVITLSPGYFYIGPDTIKKEITIIGAGAFGSENVTVTSIGNLVLNADNVKIEGIHFVGQDSKWLTIHGTKNCYIKRCKISGTLLARIEHNNTIIDNCVIQEDQCFGWGMNYCMKNSIIGHFNIMSGRAGHQIYVTNCVVLDFDYFDNEKSSPSRWIYEQPTGIYKNNVLGYYCNINTASVAYLSSPSEFYYNIFIATSSYSNKMNFNSKCIQSNNTFDKMDTYFTGSRTTYSKDATSLLGLRNMRKYVKGQDGTYIGVSGGTGFHNYPSIPRVSSKTIDSNTDNEGKINVKLTVIVEQ